MAHYILFAFLLFFSSLATTFSTESLSPISSPVSLHVRSHSVPHPLTSTKEPNALITKHKHTKSLSKHKHSKLNHIAKKAHPHRLHHPRRHHKRRNRSNQNARKHHQQPIRQHRHRRVRRRPGHPAYRKPPTTPPNAALPSVPATSAAEEKKLPSAVSTATAPNTKQATQQSSAAKDTAQTLMSKSSVHQSLDEESVRPNHPHPQQKKGHHYHHQTQPAPQSKTPPPPKTQNPKPKQKQTIERPDINLKAPTIPHAPAGQNKSNPSKKKKCTYRRKRCGSKCSSTKGKNGKCQVTVEVPNICEKSVVETGLCSGNKPKLCNYVEEEPSICTKTKMTKVQCPPQKYRCDKRIVEKKSCAPDGCDKWRKKPCKKPDPKRKVPCRKPKKACKDCRGKNFFTKCKRNKVRTIEVPCPQQSVRPSTSPYSPSPYTTPGNQYPVSPKVWTPRQKPYPSASPSPCISHHPLTDPYSGDSFARQLQSAKFNERDPRASAIRCVASSFAISECRDAVPGCRMGSGVFNKDQCIFEACSQCLQQSQHKPTNIGDWCHQFQQKHCFSRNEQSLFEPLHESRNVNERELNQIKELSSQKWASAHVADTSKKCFKEVTETESYTCRKKLPGHEMCIKGCRVKKCSPPPGKYFCKDRMPPHCPKNRKKTCKTRKTIKATCTKPGKWNCDSKVTTQYICNKKKKVKRPCKATPCRGVFECALAKLNKKCRETVRKKYACGTKKEKKETACSQHGGSNCKPVYCKVRWCK